MEIKDFLIVVPSKDIQKGIAKTEHYVCWQAALEIVFEKWGLLSFDVKTENELENLSLLASYSHLVITRDAISNQAIAQYLYDHEKLVFWECPNNIPSLIVNKQCTIEGGRSLFINEKFSKLLKALHPTSYNPDSGVQIAPKIVKTVKKEYDYFTERQNVIRNKNDFKESFNSFVLNLLFNLKARFKRNPLPFDNNKQLDLCLQAFQFIKRKLNNNSEHERAYHRFVDATIIRLKQHLVNHIDSPGNSLSPFDVEASKIACAIQDKQNISVTDIYSAFNGKNTNHVFASIALLYSKKKCLVASELYKFLLDNLYDAESGMFYNANIESNGINKKQSYCNNPSVWKYSLSIVENLSLPHFGHFLANKFTKDFINCWSNSPLCSILYKNTSQWISIAKFDNNSMAIMQKDKNVVFNFPIFAHIIHFHTCQPLEEGYASTSFISPLLLESLFQVIMKKVIINFGGCYFRLKPWPKGYDYCLSIRHDVDRIPSDEDLARLVNFHVAEGLGVTWLWLPFRLDNYKIRILKEKGFEIGLHSVRTINKRDEVSTLKNVSNCDIYGEAVHGAASDAWLGASTVKSCYREGLKYCEFSPDIKVFPYSSFPVADPSGQVEIIRGLVGITYADTVDPIPSYFEEQGLAMKMNVVNEWINLGGHIVLLNHPDISYETLKERIKSYPKLNRLNWTLKEVAIWWEATRNSSKIKVSRLSTSPMYILEGFPSNIAYEVIN